MEPTNNPMPTTNPVPEPVAPPVPPVPPVPDPVVPAPEPAAPISEPVAPAPVEPVAPAPEPVAPAPAPEPAAPAPVEAPVIAPGAPNPVASNPMFQPVNTTFDTAPIMMPEAPKAPDPVEEELKTPLTPAAPVPGSIGSAVSVPAGAPAQTPNVAFTDPATQEKPLMNTTAPASASNKPKMSKTTLYLLIAVGVLVVIALGVVLMSSMK